MSGQKKRKLDDDNKEDDLAVLKRELDDLKKKIEEQKVVVAAYRMICPECIQCIDVPRKHVVEAHGIGAGRDYDGGYDSGRSEVRFKCPKCETAIVKSGTIASRLGDSVFKVGMP